MTTQIDRHLISILLAMLLAAACVSSPNQATPPPYGLTDTGIVAVQAHADEAQPAETNQLISTRYATTAVSATGTESLEQALIQLYQHANPAVVYIIATSNSSGSGFVIRDRGYIVTNHHVVASSSSYEVVFAKGERLPAKLIGADPDSDLAVIQVADLPDGVEPLPLAEADTLQVGQFVAAIGNPFGEQGSMTLGIVSGLNRSLPSQRELSNRSSYSLPEVIQTDAPINPGNSGGPLLNLAGQVVGVNAAIASASGAGSGVGFSIPVSAVRQVIPALIQDGKYTYPYIGASFDEEVSLAEETAYGLSQTRGAYVVAVTAGGPADQAGLVPANATTGQGGDLVIQIDDRRINDFSDLNSYLVFHTMVGQTIQLTVLRNGEQVVLPLTLKARP